MCLDPKDAVQISPSWQASLKIIQHHNNVLQNDNKYFKEMKRDPSEMQQLEILSILKDCSKVIDCLRIFLILVSKQRKDSYTWNLKNFVFSR